MGALLHTHYARPYTKFLTVPPNTGWIEILNAARRFQSAGQMQSAHPTTQTIKVGRNDPCPCGSGKKYKKCCGLN
jgi:uncharacterized protein YchJ